MPTLTTAKLEETVNKAITQLARGRKTINYDQLYAQLADTSGLETWLEELTSELDAINGLIEHLQVRPDGQITVTFKDGTKSRTHHSRSAQPR